MIANVVLFVLGAAISIIGFVLSVWVSLVILKAMDVMP